MPSENIRTTGNILSLSEPAKCDQGLHVINRKIVKLSHVQALDVESVQPFRVDRVAVDKSPISPS